MNRGPDELDETARAVKAAGRNVLAVRLTSVT